MKRNVFLTFLAAGFNVSLAIAILAHCGSTWTTQPPTFGPQLGSNGCTIGDEFEMTTSKSVDTTIYWTVGPPLQVVITDSGENQVAPTLGFGTSCWRCFTIFNAPEFIDIGGGVTRWSQKTWKQTVNDDGECLQSFLEDQLITTLNALAV